MPRIGQYSLLVALPNAIDCSRGGLRLYGWGMDFAGTLAPLAWRWIDGPLINLHFQLVS